MDKQLQQRLLGAAVIVALVVIFVPELVKSPEERASDPVSEELPVLPERPPAEDGLVITLPPAQRLSADSPGEPAAYGPPEPETLASDFPESGPAPVEDPPRIPEVASPEPIAEPEDALPPREEPVATAEPPPPARAVEPPPPQPPPAQRAEPDPPARTARVEPQSDVEPILPELQLIARPMEQYQAQTGQGDQPRWVIQAGSFEAAENARQLRDRLRAQQFPATLTQATVNGRILYRVRIGPHSSRAEGERVRDRLRNETGIDGSLIPVYN